MLIEQFRIKRIARDLKRVNCRFLRSVGRSVAQICSSGLRPVPGRSTDAVINARCLFNPVTSSRRRIVAPRTDVSEAGLREAILLARDQKALGRPTNDGSLPDVEFSIVDVSFDAVADPAKREYLQNLPTSFTLTDELS